MGELSTLIETELGQDLKSYPIIKQFLFCVEK